jgi:acid phosphatase type 7
MHARLPLLLVTALIGACGNQAGNHAATKFGDLSNPAERGDALAELRAACGADGATLAEHPTIPRDPYLQQVTTSSALVGWVTPAPETQRVEVTTPDGRAIGSATAEPERTVTQPIDGRQVWAQLAELEPDTIYCYALVDASGPLTERIGFRTAPLPDTTRPIRFLAFGDSGMGGEDQVRLLEQMHAFPYELAVHTGDLAYDRGTLAQLEAYVFGIYGELLRHLPLFPVAGNHEYDTKGGAPFRDVFALPGNTEQWYSFDWGPIHFAAIDTEASYAVQARWLAEDLAATSQPWKIVYLHRPPYSSGKRHGSDKELRAALEPVFVEHGVQLVLSGHDHHYERTHPQHGVTHVLTGGGGGGTRAAGSSRFTAFAEDVIHFVYVEVYPDELVLHAIDATGQEFDSARVPRVPAN